MERLERCADSENSFSFWDKSPSHLEGVRMPTGRALPALAAEAEGDFVATPSICGRRGSESQASRGAPQRVGARWHRPSRTRVERPLSPHAALPGAQGRAGPPRCAGGWAGVRKVCRRVPARPPLPLPRGKVKVSASRGRALGGGAGADLGAGAGYSRGHGWARPPPPSQPETEARPWGLVPGRGAPGRGRGHSGGTAGQDRR